VRTRGRCSYRAAPSRFRFHPGVNHPALYFMQSKLSTKPSCGVAILFSDLMLTYASEDLYSFIYNDILRSSHSFLYNNCVKSIRVSYEQGTVYAVLPHYFKSTPRILGLIGRSKSRQRAATSHTRRGTRHLPSLNEVPCHVSGKLFFYSSFPRTTSFRISSIFCVTTNIWFFVRWKKNLDCS
jgi:hypothetical protein